MGAVLVVAYPVPLDSSGVQLGPRISVYPDALPPFGYARQVGLLSVELSIWCDIADGPRQCAVLEPSDMVDSLCPEVLGKAAVVQDRADALADPSIEGLGYPIVLWGVVCGGPTLGTLLVEEFVNSSPIYSPPRSE
jgi:hypothetical protein